MKATNKKSNIPTLLYILFSMALLLSTVSSYAQQTTVRDSTSTTFSFNNLLLPNPNSIVSKYTYNPITDR